MTKRWFPQERNPEHKALGVNLSSYELTIGTTSQDLQRTAGLE
jgi:hypothetical protein